MQTTHPLYWSKTQYVGNLGKIGANTTFSNVPVHKRLISSLSRGLLDILTCDQSSVDFLDWSA